MVIKTLNKINPLSDYGKIITNGRFIGRGNFIETIHNRVLVENKGGNIAIMGLPRVGKSSLAWNALVNEKSKQIKLNRFIININVGSISTSEEFYETLINEFFMELEFEEIEEIINDKKFNLLKKIRDNIFDKDLKSIEKKSYIQRFYIFMAKFNIKIIYILDEFDHIGKIFKLENFQFLREIIIKADMRINLITISRRTINEIELLENEAISKLAGVFSDLNLNLFTDNEVKQYWEELTKFKIQTDEEYREIVKYYAGNHPYLIDIFNYNIIDEIMIKDIEINKIIENRIKLTFFNAYDDIINLLKEEKLYDKIIQILFGPRYDLDQKSIERLVKFGMIYKDEDKKYKCFSIFFKEYLSLKQNEIDFWPLWTETETILRNIIKEKLIENYGEIWEEKFIKKYSKKENSLKELKVTMEKNKKSFAERASTHLVDYTYPQNMYEIFISTEWSNVYYKIFDGEKREWNKIFELLAKIRNPIAHNNEYFLDSSDKNLAITYCNKIKKILG